jgi:hypothetical protein
MCASASEYSHQSPAARARRSADKVKEVRGAHDHAVWAVVPQRPTVYIRAARQLRILSMLTLRDRQLVLRRVPQHAVPPGMYAKSARQCKGDLSDRSDHRAPWMQGPSLSSHMSCILAMWMGTVSVVSSLSGPKCASAACLYARLSVTKRYLTGRGVAPALLANALALA